MNFTSDIQHVNIVYKYAHGQYIKHMKNNFSLHPVQLQQALIPVCKMVIKFGLQSNEFQKNIQRAYLKAAEELLMESDIAITNQALAVKTGMDRRTVSEYRGNNYKTDSQPMNKMDLIIAELQRHRTQKNSSEISEQQLVEKVDGIYAKHIRAKAVIRELLANQIISKLSDGLFRINTHLNQQLDMQRQLADEVDITTKRLFQTFYKKMFTQQSPTADLNQQTVCSSKIPHSKHPLINQLIQEKLIVFQREMHALIQQHEARVPENTYANVGFSQFQFDSFD
ncbi:hypothetical protein [Marinicella sp. W31]|uniref:hypothetical protein n=1 Tax=Marinicella sp. W31 TaxID=3023713 RepID=UPI00375808A4